MLWLIILLTIVLIFAVFYPEDKKITVKKTSTEGLASVNLTPQRVIPKANPEDSIVGETPVPAFAVDTGNRKSAYDVISALYPSNTRQKKSVEERGGRMFRFNEEFKTARVHNQVSNAHSGASQFRHSIERDGYS